MDAELKAEWIEALRSGKYNQARGSFCARNDEGDVFAHCCLAVLADIAKPDGWFDKKNECLDEHAWERDGELSAEARAQVGIAEDEQMTLIRLNDGDATFSEIADEIERTL